MVKKTAILSFLMLLLLSMASAIAAVESVSIIRQDCTGYSNCYTSLSAWEAAQNRDLVASNEIAVARIEGPWTNSDTTPVVISGWTTGPNNYIKIYTTPEARHGGKWDTGKYRLEASETTALSIYENYARIEGLQISVTAASLNYRYGIHLTDQVTGGSDIKISQNIIKGIYSGTSIEGRGIYHQSWNATSRIWNNVVYNFVNGGTTSFYGIVVTGGTSYVYNNTVQNCYDGYYSSSNTIVAKNNMAQDCTDGFAGNFDVSSNYNLSDLAIDAPGANPKNSTAVTFIDKINKDFHLSSADTSAKDAGLDLSADANLSFTDDIDYQIRSGTWDIGADETVLTGPADTTAPAAVNNLAASTGTNPGEINLTWTAPGDDGNTGTAAAYTIKYASSAITTEAQFSAATDITGEPLPLAASTNQSMTATGLTAGQIYYFAVKTQDEVPNISGLSNSPSAVSQYGNTAPVLALIGNKTVTEGASLSFTISATDADGDLLTYSASGLPTGAAFDPVTKTFSWIPTSTQVGSYPAVHFEASDGVLVDSEDITITVVNSTISQQVWIADSMEKIQPYQSAGIKTSAQLYSAKNEYESFQIVISGTSENINNITLSASDLTGPNGSILKSNFQFYREHYIYIKKASDNQSIGVYGGSPVFVPDALVPYERTVPPTYDPDNTSTVVLSLNSVYNKVFWVDLYVPSGTSPGDYTGSITVNVGGEIHIVPVKVTVWNLTLPVNNSFDIVFAFSPYAAEQGHGFNDQYALAQEYARIALDHRISFYQGYRKNPTYTYNDGGTPYNGTDDSLRDDSMTLDWSEFDALVGPMINGSINSVGRGFDMVAINTLSALVGDVALRDISAPFSPDAEMKLVLYWREVAKHFKGKGWIDKLFLYNTDEPWEAIYETRTLYISKLMFYADPDVPVMVTEQYNTVLDRDIAINPSDPKFNTQPNFYPKNPVYNPSDPEYDAVNPSKSKYVKHGIDIWDPVNRNFGFDVQADPNVYTRQQAGGDKVWWYLSCVSWTCDDVDVGQWGNDYDIGTLAIDAESVYIRHVFWLSRLFNIEGLLTWGTVEGFRNSNAGDPWINQFSVEAGSGGNGDGTLFYPGRPSTIGGTTHIAVPSIRMKIIRESMEDYEYFRLLDNIGQGNFVKAAISSVVTNTQNWSHNYQDYINKRKQLAEAYLGIVLPNNPPVLAAIGNKTVTEGASLSFAVSATDADGDLITYSASNLPTGAAFDPVTKTFSWIPTYAQAGSYNISFSVSDAKGGVSSETITITVTDVTQAVSVMVMVGNSSGYQGNLNKEILVSVGDVTGLGVISMDLALDYNAAELTFVSASTAGTIASSWPAPAYNSSTPGKLLIALYGTTPLSGQGDLLKLYFNVNTTASVGTSNLILSKVKINDGIGIISTLQNGTFTVLANQAPILDLIGNKTVNEGELLNIVLTATDADNYPLPLVYSASGLPTGAAFDPVTKTFSWTPDYTQAGSYPLVHFEATDGVLVDSEDITITVVNSNIAPVLALIGNKTVTEGASLSFAISATDADGDLLTYSASNLPLGASFDPVTKTFSWTPDYTQAGSYTVSFSVSDGKGGSDSKTSAITVTNTNRAPVLDAIGAKTIILGSTLTFSINATDADNDSLTYSASNLPQGASFDVTTRTFSWTPGSGKAGSYTVTFTVTDSYGDFDNESIIITVSMAYGDVNGDTEVSAYDAALAAQYAVGLITLTQEQIKAANVTTDIEVSAYDAALIAQKAVGLISKFPREQ